MNRLKKKNKRKLVRAEEITAYNKGLRHGAENYHPYKDQIRYNVNRRLQGVMLHFNKGFDAARF